MKYCATYLDLISLLMLVLSCTSTRIVTDEAAYRGDYVKKGLYALQSDVLLVDRKHRGWGPASAWAPELKYDAMPDDPNYYIWTKRSYEEIEKDREKPPRERCYVNGVLTKGTRMEFVELLLYQHPGTIDTIPVARVLDGEHAGILVSLKAISKEVKSPTPRYFVDQTFLKKMQ